MGLSRACRNLLLIGRSNDILARIWLGEHTFMMGKPLHQTPIENAGGDERIHVTDGETALTLPGPFEALQSMTSGDLQVFSAARNIDGVQ